jgi:acyl-CoA oxidase
MGLCSVDRKGNFSITGDLRALYIVMMMIRTQIVSKSSWTLGCGLLIALRYAVVRRQFKTQHGMKEERQIMNYQTHIHKFAPLMGQLYVQMGIGNFICEEFTGLLKGAETGDFKKLDVMHHLLSGYKSLFSERTLDSIEICRKNCGGAGYSALSGLPNLVKNYSPVPTYEGDNTVMLL